MSWLWFGCGLAVAQLDLAAVWRSDLCLLHATLLPEPRLKEQHPPERFSWQVTGTQEERWKCSDSKKSFTMSWHSVFPSVVHWSEQVMWPSPKSKGQGTTRHMASAKRGQKF